MRLAVVIALAACGSHREVGPIDQEAARGVFEQVRIDAPHGISDLTIDDRGVMWAVAERDRFVVEIELGKPPIRHSLDGIPKSIDTEGIAWLGDGQFAISTEGAHEATAAIMFGELRSGRLVVTRTRAITSEELGVEMTANHGIESVCGNREQLLAASETVGKLPDGSRYAPLVRLRGDALSITKLRLTSDRGKISALHCTFDAEGDAQVVAIERHFGVARILKFTVGRDDVEVTPAIEIDLHPILRDALNLEGIVRLPDGRLVAINDNQARTANGPTQLLVFTAR
jgi:hypothetical protein